MSRIARRATSFRRRICSRRAPPRNVELGKRELDAMGVKLMDALRTFRVEAELVGRTTGPVVTQFEVEPAPGVKVRQIANLSNDLALAMRAREHSHRRADSRARRRRRRGAESDTGDRRASASSSSRREFQNARAALPIALGKDLEGKPVIADLAKMPHLLIAGATGSGKSVCVNTIITSLVYRHTPKTLRFLMVDPKMVELSVYNTLPHLRHKVITDNRDAAAVLKWADDGDAGALRAARGERLPQHSGLQSPRAERRDAQDAEAQGRRVRGRDVHAASILPYIVVVIDELADLDDDGAGRGRDAARACSRRRRARSASTSSSRRSARA